MVIRVTEGASSRPIQSVSHSVSLQGWCMAHSVSPSGRGKREGPNNEPRSIWEGASVASNGMGTFVGVLNPEDLNHLGEHQSSTHQFYSKKKITSMAKLWYSLYKCLPNLLFKIFAWCWWWWGHFSTRFNIWFPVSPWTRKADDISWSEWSVEHSIMISVAGNIDK